MVVSSCTSKNITQELCSGGKRSLNVTEYLFSFFLLLLLQKREVASKVLTYTGIKSARKENLSAPRSSGRNRNVPLYEAVNNRSGWSARRAAFQQKYIIIYLRQRHKFCVIR